MTTEQKYIKKIYKNIKNAKMIAVNSRQIKIII